MIIAASLLLFDEKRYDDVIDLLKKYNNIETHEKDIKKGKMIITIEAEDNKDIEDIEEYFAKYDFIIDLSHFAFHFGDEVEKVLTGEKVPSF